MGIQTRTIVACSITVALIGVTLISGGPIIPPTEGQFIMFPLHELGIVGNKGYTMEHPSNVQPPMSWEGASDYCAGYHGRLATLRIQTEEQIKFFKLFSSINPIDPNKGFWVAGDGYSEEKLCSVGYFGDNGLTIVEDYCEAEHGALCENDIPLIAVPGSHDRLSADHE